MLHQGWSGVRGGLGVSKVVVGGQVVWWVGAGVGAGGGAQPHQGLLGRTAATATQMDGRRRQRSRATAQAGRQAAEGGGAFWGHGDAV